MVSIWRYGKSRGIERGVGERHCGRRSGLAYIGSREFLPSTGLTKPAIYMVGRLIVYGVSVEIHVIRRGISSGVLIDGFRIRKLRLHFRLSTPFKYFPLAE